MAVVCKQPQVIMNFMNLSVLVTDAGSAQFMVTATNLALIYVSNVLLICVAIA
jgi:hypothetical protein